jgi:hypothetical protein
VTVTGHALGLASDRLTVDVGGPDGVAGLPPRRDRPVVPAAVVPRAERDADAVLELDPRVGHGVDDERVAGILERRDRTLPDLQVDKRRGRRQLEAGAVLTRSL